MSSCAFAGGRVAASTIINSIVNIFAAGLRFTKLCIDLEFNEAGDPRVFENFLLLDKSITCFKLFITAYRDVHANGFGTSPVSCLVGLFLHLFTILIYLYKNHKPWARAWVRKIIRITFM
nr:uncharacterized protein LOC123493467 [Aegilops tauschii subsp. strangulata]